MSLACRLAVAHHPRRRRVAGEKWYNEKFLPYFGPVALLSLIYTIIVLFTLQGHEVRSDCQGQGHGAGVRGLQ